MTTGIVHELIAVWVPEGEERQKKAEHLFNEIMDENFPNLRKETDIQVQGSLRVSKKINPKKSTHQSIL